MADSSPDRIVVSCSCGAKLRVAATSIGKKAKCPKCGGVIAITGPTAAAPQKKVRVKPTPPPPPPDDDTGGLLDDLAMHEQAAEASGSPCPGCGTLLQPGTRMCVSCGFDTQKGVSRQTTLLPSGPADDGVAKQLAKRAGTFAIGIALSGVGAAIGAAV